MRVYMQSAPNTKVRAKDPRDQGQCLKPRELILTGTEWPRNRLKPAVYDHLLMEFSYLADAAGTAGPAFQEDIGKGLTRARRSVT